MDKGSPLIVSDMLRDPDTAPAAKRILGRRVYLGVPMKVKGKIIGVLVVIGQSDRIFTQDEVALLSSIAQQIGVAVDNARLHKQAEISAITEERQRLAREIHDTLAQGFTGINIQLEAIESALDMGKIKLARERIDRTRYLANQSLSEARRSVWALRSPSLVKRKLANALRDSIHDLTAETGLVASIEVQDALPELPEDLETDLLRIALEAVMNVVKHAQATNLIIQLDYKDSVVRMSIQDDGRGFLPEQVSQSAYSSSGFGLVTMKERISRHGGALDIRSIPQFGTRIIAEVRFDEQEAIDE